MCGIVGFVTSKYPVNSDLVTKMAKMLTHRGPDDEGYWLDAGAGLALGHRRLSIVDLSPQGHQPMQSACGRYVITFNGEVYNFRELREQLDAYAVHRTMPWRGHSDTEVMLAAISIWGFEEALEKFSGMFAFALWDKQERVLHLVRDRLGEKPLYYGEIGSSFVFGSELKALRVFPNSGLEIDRDAVADLLRFGYIPSPRSIYRGIRKLEPGSLLSVHVAQAGSYRCSAPRKYWALDRPVEGRSGSVDGNAGEGAAVEELHTLLRNSVRRQMISDVPLGAFLSGGIDSSVVVALMQAQSSRPVRTFTIGFREQGFDEAPHAKAIAALLGTDHTEFYVTPREAAAVIPRLAEIYDEPFADSSQIPTFLVSRLTRQHVTVSLSGDGGDELFAGYPRYQFGEALWSRIRRFPRWSRRAASISIGGLSAQSWDRILGPLLPSRLRSVVTGHRLHRFVQLLEARGFGDMYARLVSQWQRAETIVQGTAARHEDGADSHEACSFLNQMRLFDLRRYLPDDLLVKVDRASMSVSLESRAPMLDHQLVEFAWRLPEKLLVRNGRSKWILRQVLDRYVPRHLVERPKAGFGMPLAKWLRGELGEWAQHLLDEGAIRAQGFLDPVPVQAMWEQHLSGKHDRSAYLWNVLMFQAWLEKEGRAAPHDVPSGAAQAA
jgi:asparagine synthase (glutamine-hydrolysing)